MSGLVLSLFPGIGLLDMAFEEEGFCVVRGPDLLWGGDIRKFHPPAGKFDGVIGGPPCQAFSQLRHIVEANGFSTAPNLIPEFERCVEAARPDWFLMENVPAAPEPEVTGYWVFSQMVRDVWVGGMTQRLRRFTWGNLFHKPLNIETLALHPEGEGTVVAGHGLAPGQRDRARKFQIETLALHQTEEDAEFAVTCDPRKRPVALLSGMRPKKPKESGGKTSSLNRGGNVMELSEACRLQGLPEDFLADAPFTVHGKRKVIGNGVPLPMGRAVARAVKAALQQKEHAA